MPIYPSILRVFLLTRHGSPGCDTTCPGSPTLGRLRDIVLDTDNPEAYVSRISLSFPLKNFISNWFLMSSAGHIVPTAAARLFMLVLGAGPKRRGYHWFHAGTGIMFRTRSFVPVCGPDTPASSSGRAHFLQRCFDRPHDKDELKMIWAAFARPKADLQA
ncbi:MAG: hypothetical protein U5N10_13595 [Gemmobacter sp.]|nr:hypothetical protein [Gemmobacter sp.]